MLGTFAVLLATMYYGLAIGEVREDPTGFRRHFLLGLASALVVMFTNGIVVTYFIGTSRWCKEVAQTYALDDALWQRSAAIKRRAFPLTVAGMLMIVVVAALGAICDPATAMPAFPWQAVSWSDVHLATAILTVVLLCYVAYYQATAIRENQAVINEIMEHVRRIRKEKGLPE